jgi:MFS superfamily sulfate permease-like transporter
VRDEPVLIKVVVLDMTAVRRIDTTGLQALRDLEADLYEFGGNNVELRFVNVKRSVRGQFERFGWMLYDADSLRLTEGTVDGGSGVYQDVKAAILERGQRMALPDLGTKDSVTMTEKVEGV